MSYISILLSILVAFIIGIVAGKVSPLGMAGKWAGAIVAGFIGNWIGIQLFGSMGPMVLGFSLIPALIGAVLVAVIAGGIAKLFD